MPNLSVTQIRIYPIKSLGAIHLQEAVLEPRGFRYDRRWMLVAPGTGQAPWQFITQRTVFPMALIDVALTDSHLQVWHRHRPADRLAIPLEQMTEETLPVQIWDDQVLARAVSAEADAWFSRELGFSCRLVRMPESTERMVDPAYAQDGEIVSFADAYPYLLIGQASLDELNRRLGTSLEMSRFRPNLVVAGGTPHEEDTWYQLRLGGLPFYGVKPCARCVLTTIDPQTGEKGTEPLKTLAAYRKLNHKIYFGQNLLPAAAGVLRVGDPVEVVERRPARVPFP